MLAASSFPEAATARARCGRTRTNLNAEEDRMKRRPSPVRLAVAVVCALAVSAMIGAGSASAVTTVNGSVGPGFTISLKLNGKKVTKLRATTYKFKVSDKSNIHNFHLIGPGVNKKITTVGFKGTKTVSVKLKKGTYRYICDPHASSMKGSFKVG
jgi:plastocyanin